MTEKLENFTNAQKYEIKLPAGQIPRCQTCKSTMEIIRPTKGKYVLTLNGLYEQWTWYYICKNQLCPGYEQKTLLGERLDYGKEQWGKDILEKVTKYVIEGKLKTSQIVWLFQEVHHIKFSEHIIRKMTDDALLLKARQINLQTEMLMKEKRKIILGIDGQDPDTSAEAILALVDLERRRLLRTVKVNSADHTVIHEMIEETLRQYDVELMGVVSDKQGNIRKCMEVFYPEIPHQFCTFHFFYNIWKHLEMFDNRIHMEARKLLKDSPLYQNQAYSTIGIDDLGTKIERDEVFEETRNDIIALCGIRSKTFETLHGWIIYQKLKQYCEALEESLKTVSKRAPLAGLITGQIQKFRAFLKAHKTRALQCERFHKKFKKIYTIAYSTILHSDAIKKQLSQLIEFSWKIAQRELGIQNKEQLRSFLPRSTITWGELNGELVRLWESYQSGLFAYEQLPIDVRTNTILEHGFSVEKTRLLGCAGKKKVGFLMQTRGELVLRLSYATESELSRSILVDFDYAALKQLRSSLRAEISFVTATWQYKDRCFTGPSSLVSICASFSPSP